MHAAVAVSYFHRKIGPMVFYNYPEDALKEEEKIRLADIMDQAFEEGFFTHRFGDLHSMNYYFEIQSEWARGNKEMLMISVLMDSTPVSDIESTIVSWCTDFAGRLKSHPEIYKAFYNVDDSQVTEGDKQDIKKFSLDLHFWVKELYWMAIEQLREKTEEEKWASIMSQPHVFRIIKHLSTGPLSLDDLQKWFSIIFPRYSLNDCLTLLENEKFVFRNTIGQDTYVLLVKDVNIARAPPNCIIDLEEDSPELADLTEIYINEVREFFDSYKQTPMDSLELFKLFADPKIYNVISQLREGHLPKDKVLALVSEKSSQSLLTNLELLKEKNIIQEFSYGGDNLFILKADVILTASFPEYLKKLVHKEIKDYTAKSYSTKTLRFADGPDENPNAVNSNEEMKLLDIFQENPTSNEIINRLEMMEEKNVLESSTVPPKTSEPSTSPDIPLEDRSADYYSPFSVDFEEKITPDMQKVISSQFKDLISKEDLINPKEQKEKN